MLGKMYIKRTVSKLFLSSYSEDNMILFLYLNYVIWIIISTIKHAYSSLFCVCSLFKTLIGLVFEWIECILERH